MTPRAQGGPGGADATAASEGDRAQLDWEARAGRPAAAAAFGAALLPVLGGIVFVSSLGDAGEGTSGLLSAVEGASAGVLAGALLNSLGTLLLAVALGYLYRVTRARRPQAPSFARTLLIAAAVGLAVVLTLQQLFLLEVASDFAGGSDSSEAAADDLIAEGGVQATGFVEAGLRLALGAAVILIALNAMRAGLLGRFMGIIGIGVGVFYAIPIGNLADPTLIQLFWGVALGLLFLGRWPGGERGPAWERVEEIPWPTTASRLEAQRQTRVDEAQSATGDGNEPSGDGPDPRPASRKRRRGR